MDWFVQRTGGPIIASQEIHMKRKKNNFKKLLQKYLKFKGLDIVIYTVNGDTIELNKNRTLVKNDIVIYDKNNKVVKIPISLIKYVDLYAA
jgi:hypothetical protein